MSAVPGAEETAEDLVDRCYRRALARKKDAAAVGLRTLLAEVLTELGLPGRRSPAAEPEYGLVDFDPARFGLVLVDRQAPPAWHPEHPEGGL